MMESVRPQSTPIVKMNSYASLLNKQTLVTFDNIRSAITTPTFVDLICNKLTDIFLSGATPFARAELAHQMTLQCAEGHMGIPNSDGTARRLRDNEKEVFLYFFSNIYKAMELFVIGQENSYSFCINDEKQRITYNFSLMVTDSADPSSDQNCKTVILKYSSGYENGTCLESSNQELITFQINSDKNNIRINDKNGKSGQTEEMWNNISQPDMVAQLQKQCTVICQNVTSEFDLKLRMIEMIEGCPDNKNGLLLSKLFPIIVGGVNKLVNQMKINDFDNNQVIVTFIDSKNFDHQFEITATDEFAVTLKPVSSRKFDPIVLLPNDTFEELLTKSPIKSAPNNSAKRVQTNHNNTNVAS